MSAAAVPGSTNATEPYRFMFSTTRDRAAALEGRLVEIGDRIAERRFQVQKGEALGITPKERFRPDGNGTELLGTIGFLLVLWSKFLG